MKSIVNIRIARPERQTPIGGRNPVGSPISKASLDLDAANDAVNRFRTLSVREASLNELNTAIADLTRAGVRADSRHAMIGRTLLAQLLTETERRANRPAPVVDVQRAPAGAYSALVLKAERDHAPKKYDRYV